MKIVDQFPCKVRHIEHVMIPMPDGVQLAARMWIPEGADQEPVPAIFEYVPYRKRDITRLRDDQTHPYLAGNGYACVRVDLRGSGESDGVLVDQYRQQELDDGVSVIKWLASQPWCNGRVGMMGISWGGFNSLQVAAQHPSELKAIITTCSTDDLYLDNMHYMGGCLLTDNLSEATTMFTVNSSPPDPELVGEKWREMWLKRLEGSGLWLDIWLRHQRRDAYWEHGSVSEDYSSIQCPVMAVGGWADGYTNAIFRLLEHLEAPRIGLIGPWGHRYPHRGIPGPAIGFLQESLRWWDYWLKDIETMIMDEPMLRAWMQDSVPPTTRYEYRPGRWVAEAVWPPEKSSELSLYLTPDKLVNKPPENLDEEICEPIQSPLSTGLFAGKWCSYTAAPDLPHDQREEDGGALVYETQPLEADIEILGTPVADLVFASSRPIAMVAVRLSDVAPDGKATRVTYGLFNLTHLNGHDQPEVLDPNQKYQVRVHMNYIAQSFPRGHRIRLSVSTSYWPLAWPSPEPVSLDIFMGHSALLLPVRGPSPEDKKVQFEEAEGSPVSSVEIREPPHHNWLVHRDLASDESELEVIKDEGRYYIPDIDLEISDAIWNWYTYQGDDFSSPKGETRTQRCFSRGDWKVKTTTRTVLRADTESFYITAELDAYEGDERIYSQNWSRKIRRDHI